jgi:hypothetical protein
MHGRQARSEGFIFLASLGVILFLTLAGSSLLVGGVAHTNQSLRTYDRDNAVYLAEAGIQQALLHLQTQSTGDDTMGQALATGSFTVESQEPLSASLVRVVSRGQSDAEARRLEAFIRVTSHSVFQYAVLGDDGVTMSGDMRTDSYDSRLGAYDPDPSSPTYNKGHNGDIATNSSADGALDLSGGSLQIDGQLVTGPDVTDPASMVNGYSPSLITGGTDPPSDGQDVASLPEEILLEPVVVPDGIACADKTVKAHQNLTLSPTGGPLGNGTYCYQNLSVEGGATVTVTGPVRVYLTGTFVAVGETVVGNPADPTDLILYVSNGGIATIDGNVAGSSTFYGGIYAPDATIAIGGEAQIYGAIVAGDAFIAGDPRIHYDEAMADMSGGPGFGTTEVEAWNEL